MNHRDHFGVMMDFNKNYTIDTNFSSQIMRESAFSAVPLQVSLGTKANTHGEKL